MKRCLVVGMIVLLSALIGCKEETSDDSLADIVVIQKKQEREIASMSGRMESVENTLAEIQQSLEKPAVTSGLPAPPVSTEGGAQDFRNTQEYAQILAALTEVQKTHQEIAEERALEELRDPRQAFQAMNDPQQMDSRLTLLVQNFSGRIQDVAKRQQFEADVQQLKQSFSTPLTVQQLYERRTAELTARLNEEQDQRRKEFIQRELNSLQTATAEQLEERLDRYQRSDTMNQLRQLQETYEIPRDVLRDSGIPTMGRGGPGGFQGGPPGGRGRGR
jgi:ribosomal protein RSM22 (predicted rRNA methylase)